MSRALDAHVLYASGFYGRALKTLERLSSQRGLSLDERVMRAELFSLTGASHKAISAAQELLRDRGLQFSDRCKLREALGSSYFRIGNYRAGTEEYEQGIRLAEAHAAANLEACELRVGLFRNKIMWIGPYQAAVEVNQLRRKVHQVGNPALAIKFQVGLVELAAKLGLLRKARRHLNAARELLPTIDNRALLATIGLIEAALTAAEGNLGRALDLSLDTMKIAEDSGSAPQLIALMNNLGHLLTAQARYAEALQWIHGALETRRLGGGTEIALRDTLMLLYVSKGDFSDAEHEAARIGALLESPHEHDSFFGLWHVATRVKWLYRTGKINQGLEEAISALPLAQRMADRTLKERLEMFVSEGLARTDRTDEAADLLAQTVLSNPDPSLGTIAEAARLRGWLLAATQPSEATNHLNRAATIFSGIGNLTAEAEVLSEIEHLLGPAQTDRTNLKALPPETGEVDWSPLRPLSRTSAIDWAERAALVIDVGSHPRLLGLILLSILEETGTIAQARLIETTGNAHHEVRRVQPGSNVISTLSDQKSVRIDLGSSRSEYLLEVVPASTPSARVAVLAVEKLARAALATDRARQSEKEQAAVWPEPVVEEQLGLVCASERIAEVINTIRRVAPSNLTILITGETGVGKELFARALHLASPRKDRTFLPFNCTAVPKDMIDSQLFGHRRGAFTGAHEEGPGVIRAASGGTLFLDEIGEMSMEAQPKLLRFLESGEIHPLGEPKPQQVDVRIVAATNKDLDQLVSDGKFREDLYYRLNVLPIQIPPLRERREEIPALVEHFLERFGREMHKPLLRVADETLEYLLLYRWPGNVRQLSNELRRIVALTEPGAVLMPSHLSKDIIASRRTVPVQPSEVVIALDQPLQDATDHLERAAIERALGAAKGNNDEAAKTLGLSRKGLYLKRQRLGLK